MNTGLALHRQPVCKEKEDFTHSPTREELPVVTRCCTSALGTSSWVQNISLWRWSPQKSDCSLPSFLTGWGDAQEHLVPCSALQLTLSSQGAQNQHPAIPAPPCFGASGLPVLQDSMSFGLESVCLQAACLPTALDRASL